MGDLHRATQPICLSLRVDCSTFSLRVAVAQNADHFSRYFPDPLLPVGVNQFVAGTWAIGICSDHRHIMDRNARSISLARCYVRTADEFVSAITLLAKVTIIVLPFALFEWVTGSNLLLRIFGAFLPTIDTVQMDPRMGLWRVQGPFPHSILFGLVCGSIVSLCCLVLARQRAATTRTWLTIGVIFTALTSMSSAPIAGLVLQLAVVSWNSILYTFKARWKILWMLLFLGYLFVEFGSNQTPIKFYISHFTFDKQTGWFRTLIWEYGSASVMAHPLFGIGLGSWARPPWMPISVDNFWLLMAMRHGLPGFAFLLAAFVWVLFKIGSNRDAFLKVENITVAYLICMISYMLVGTTVHLWDAGYTWLMFLLGSGIWLSNYTSEAVAVDSLGRQNATRQPRVQNGLVDEAVSEGEPSDFTQERPSGRASSRILRARNAVGVRDRSRQR
ncbi:MAG: hypothetical protein QM744_06690 [Mesorhizobium sp.]